MFFIPFVILQQAFQPDCEMVLNCNSHGTCTGLNICDCQSGFVSDENVGCRPIKSETSAPSNMDNSDDAPFWIWILLAVTIILIIVFIIFFIKLRKRKVSQVRVRAKTRGGDLPKPKNSSGIEESAGYAHGSTENYGGAGYPKNQLDIDYSSGVGLPVQRAAEKPLDEEEVKRRVHAETGRYVCNFCDAGFGDIDVFVKHVETQHPDR